MNHQNKGFNLVDEKWIPVTNLKGEYRLISLMDVFINGECYTDLAVRPHERVSLMRLLLCIAHASLDGPEDYDDWIKAPELLEEAAKHYLGKWRYSFDLFHPKNPFLQIDDIVSDTKTPLSKLDLALSTGNNATLFDHGNDLLDRCFSDYQIAIMLISFLCFSPGGGVPVTSWGKKKTGQVGNSDAPCIPQSMYHCFLRRENIFDTICANLLTKRIIDYTYCRKWGCPIWEKMPNSHNDNISIANATESYLGRLLPLSRWIKINKNKREMDCGNGFIYPGLKEGFPAEPTACIVLNSKKDKKGKIIESYKILGAQAGKGIWRDLASIIVKRQNGKIGSALSLQNIHNDQPVDILIACLLRNPDQIASIEYSIESVYHLPANFLSVGRAAYEKEINFTELISKKLGWAVEKYRQLIDADWDKRIERTEPKKRGQLKARLYLIATTHYWTTIEKSHPHLMTYIEALSTSAEQVEKIRTKWHKLVFSAALESYELVCGRETPRQIRAFSAGWQVLNRKEGLFNESNNKTNEEEEGL